MMRARLSADMLMATRKGDWKKVETLLQQRADVNACGAHKISPLMLAVTKGEPEVCDMLLSHRAVVDARDSLPHRQTALMYASTSTRMRALEVLRVLLGGAATLDLQDTSGRTALILAAEIGDLAVVRLLLEHKADVHLIAQVEGLNNIAMGFPKKSVRKFLERPSAPPTNAVDTYMRAQRRQVKETEEAAQEEFANLGNEMDIKIMVSEPSMYISGTSEVIDEHITESQRIEETSIDGVDSEEDDSEDGSYDDEIAYDGYLPNGMFLSKVAPLRPKDLAKQALEPDTQKKLMAQSEKIRCIKRCPLGTGDTALTISARVGHADVCELLLLSRADCHALDGNGEAPLRLAAHCGHVAACRIFLTRVTSLEAHSTALRAAEMACQEGVVRLLRGYQVQGT